MNNSCDFDLLVVGFDIRLTDLLKPDFEGIRLKPLTNAAEVDGFLEQYQLNAGTPVLISTSVEGMNHFEIGQAFSSYFTGLQLVFVTFDRAQFEFEKLKKNGFSKCFLLPLDKSVLLDFIGDIKASKPGGGFKKYKAVKLVDIQPGEKLPFEIRTFLPANNKYVVLNSNGELSDKKFDKLKERNVNSIFVDTNQIEKFYEFVADKLISSGASSNDAISQTEKSERLKSTVRELFISILDSAGKSDFDAGRDLLDQSKKIVENYVEKKTGLDLKQTLTTIMGEGKDAYSHAQIVSTVACLLSMATEVGNPEDLAIAGLFHDIGVHGVSEEVSSFDVHRLNEEEKKQFMQHPRLSLNLLKEKKITVTASIAEMIEKHHERVDGKGFPAQLPAHKVPMEAQLLSYADAFEYLSRPKPGQPSLKPHEIHKVIVDQVGLSIELTQKIGKFINTITA